MSKIMENARVTYIEKYGVNHSNLKLDDVDGYLIPLQEARKLAFLSMVREME